MASVQAERDPVVVERIQQLIGAIHVMHKMVGDKSQPWIAETASSAGVSGSEAATSVFHAALTNLNDVSTKFTMIFKDATRPDQVGTYAETMERALVGLVQTSQTMLFARKAHTLLERQVNILVKDALNVALKLATVLCGPTGDASTARLTGQIWSDCDALEKLNLQMTMLDFVTQSVKQQLLAIKDALEEINEELENKDTNDVVEEEDDDFEDEEEFDFSFKPHERKILPGCVMVLKSLASFNNLIIKDMKALDESKSEDSEKTLLFIHSTSKELEETVDNFTSAIYPPQKSDEVISHARKFQDLIRAVISALIASNPNESDRNRQNQLLNTVNSVLDKAIKDIGEAVPQE